MTATDTDGQQPAVVAIEGLQALALAPQAQALATTDGIAQKAPPGGAIYMPFSSVSLEEAHVQAHASEGFEYLPYAGGLAILVVGIVCWRLLSR